MFMYMCSCFFLFRALLSVLAEEQSRNEALQRSRETGSGRERGRRNRGGRDDRERDKGVKSKKKWSSHPPVVS